MKTRNKIYILLGVAFLMLGAKALKDNTLIIGDGVNTDKEIVLDIGAGTSNPRFIWNSASNSLQFTNDNSDILDIGSGSGGGGGGINVVEEGDFEREASIDDWVNTGTGVFARTTTAANVGNGGGAASYDAALATEKITSAAFLVPNVIADTLCIAEMYYKGGGTADLTMRVVDGSDVLVPGSELIISTATTTFKRAYTTFICPTEGESVKFQLEAAGNADIIYIDDVFIGTKGLTRGAAISDWTDFTPTGSGITGGTTSAKWRQVGSNMEISYYFSGSTWGSTFTIDTPSGYVIDNSKLPNGAGGRATLGSAMAYDISAVDYYSGTAIYNGSAIWVTGDTPASAWNNAIPFGWSNGSDQLSVFVTVPIVGFDGTVNLLNNSVIYSNARFSSKGLTGAITTTTGVNTPITTWNTPSKNEGGGTFDGEYYTVPSDGTYFVTAKIRWANAITATDAIIRIYTNTGVTQLAREHQDISATGGPSMSVSYVGDFSAGDNVSITVSQNSGGNEDTRTPTEEMQFTVTRIADVSSESALGFGEADADNAGLLTNQTENGRVLVSLADAGDPANCSTGDTTAEFCSAASNSFGRADAYPYKTTSGQWRLKFNITVQLAASSSVTNFEISGVTFDYSQSISLLCANDLDGASNVVGQAFANRSGNIIKTTCSAVRGAKMLSGDVALTSKPLWLN